MTTLVPIDLSHAECMLRWMRDPSVSANVGLRRQPTIEGTVEWIQRAITREDIVAFAIIHEERHVGNVVLDEIDRFVRSARFSIYIGEPDVRGRGVGGAALSGALTHAFQVLELQKVWLTVHARNASAIASYLRNGFMIEGVHRRSFMLEGALVDAFFMGILRDEFLSRGSRCSEP